MNIEEDEDYVESDGATSALTEDYEMKQEMLLRQAKLLFPEVEEWVLDMAVKAHVNIEKLGKDYEPKTKQEGEDFKKKYFNGLEYKTEF